LAKKLQLELNMKNARVYEIDLLRFLAALAVVFFHYTFSGYAAESMSIMPYPLLASASKYGYLGVELFFMISGFVILMTAANGGVRMFLVSRIIRLFPAFWACCTITFLIVTVTGTPRFSASLNQYLINLTMLSEFFDVPSIDGAYWSLFVELRFYALVVAVLALGKIGQAQFFLAAWLAASIALEIFPKGKLRYLLIADYAPYFIAGATYFLIFSRGASVTRYGMILISWILAQIETIRNSLPKIERHYNTNFNPYIVSGVISVFFIVMLLVSLRRTGHIGRNKSWAVAGSLTYPLYLLHETIGYIIFNIAYPLLNPHLILGCTITIMLGAAYFVHIFIEKKFSQPLKKAINRLIDVIQRLTVHTQQRRNGK